MVSVTGHVVRKPMQRDMFTGNLVKSKPRSGNGNHILLKGDDQDPPVIPGMAHFAGSGPDGKRCSECRHLGDLPCWGRKARTTRELAELNEDAKPRRYELNACRKAADMFDGHVQKGGIQFNRACKYFEPTR